MQLQLWDKLRSDADSAYGHASDLIKRTGNAESAADAAAGKLQIAKRYMQAIPDTLERP